LLLLVHNCLMGLLLSCHLSCCHLLLQLHHLCCSLCMVLLLCLQLQLQRLYLGFRCLQLGGSRCSQSLLSAAWSRPPDAGSACSG
jgi:hypothetical protein